MLAVANGARGDKALELLDEMRAAGVAADPVCLKLAMEACQNQGAWRQAGEIIKQVWECVCVCRVVCDVVVAVDSIEGNMSGGIERV